MCLINSKLQAEVWPVLYLILDIARAIIQGKQTLGSSDADNVILNGGYEEAPEVKPSGWRLLCLCEGST